MFSVRIKETSKTDISKIEAVKLKDTGNAIKLDTVLDGDDPLIVTPVGYVVLEVHNDKANPADYEQYMVLDDTGQKFVTGSNSFWRSFEDIWNELSEFAGDWNLEIYKKDSKNYAGKKFISCSVL